MKNSKNARPAPAVVSHAQLKAYRKLVVPHGSTRYHVLRLYQWVAAKWKSGDWQTLDDYALQHHLDTTSFAVSSRWSLHGHVSHAVIDLDSSLKHVAYDHLRMNPNHVHVADEEMRWALIDVLEALGHPPHVVIRSSSSRGLHIYIFLDGLYPAIDVREVLVELLTLASIPPKGGVVDQIFPANQALRLPFGPGSCILDDGALVQWATGPARGRMWKAPGCRSGNVMCYAPGPKVDLTLRPVGAREVPLRPPPLLVESYEELKLGKPEPGVVRLSRNVAASIAALERLAASRQVSLSTLQATARARRGVVVRKKGKKSAGAGARAAVLSPSIGPTGTLEPARQGERYRQSRALLSTLHRSGSSRADALASYEEWLRLSAAHGTSKALRGASETTIQAQLKDGADCWTWLENHARPNAGAPFVALSSALGLPPRSVSSKTSSSSPAGPATASAPATSARTPPTSFSSSSTTTPPAWNREAALAAVTAADEAKLATIGCVWTQRKVRVLVGALRLGLATNMSANLVTIGAQVFDRIIGGRPPPASAQRIQVFPGTFLPRRAMVIQEAERLGFVERVDRGIRGKHASKFRVTLP